MNDIRKHQINFVVNENEYMLIKDKMSVIGIQNLSGFIISGVISPLISSSILGTY